MKKLCVRSKKIVYLYIFIAHAHIKGRDGLFWKQKDRPGTNKYGFRSGLSIRSVMLGTAVVVK